MKILFVLTEESTQDQYEYTFTLKLFEHLALENNAGILAGSTIVRDLRSTFNIPGRATVVSTINDIDLTAWDVIVLSDPNVLGALDDNPQLNHTDPKIVYLCHARDYRGISHANKNILLAFNIMAAGTNDWLPKEKVCNLLKPLFYELSADNRNIDNGPGKIKAIHFVHHTDDRLSVARSIIVAINCLPNVELTIVASAQVNKILTSIANHHIKFTDEASWDDRQISGFDLAITSAYPAVKTLYSSVPTIIAGTRGLGGAVTTTNVFEHIRNNFEGRIGGEIGEPIPTLGIIELILRFYEAPQEIWDETAKAAKIISHEFSARKIFEAIASEISTRLKENLAVSREDNYSLTPYKKSGARVITDQANVPHLVNIHNKVIRSMNPEEAFLLTQCDGKKTLEDIVGESRSSDLTQARAFFLELWKKDILSFK